MNDVRQFISVMFDQNQKRSAILLLLFSVVLALIEAAGIGSVFPFVALLQSPDSLLGTPVWGVLTRLFGRWSPDAMLIYLGYLLLGLFVLKNLLAALQFKLHYSFMQDFYRSLSSRLLASYMAHPYTFFLKTNSSVLAKNVTVETALVAEHIVAPGLLLIAEVLVLTTILFVLFLYQPILSLAAVVVMSTVLGGIYVLSGHFSRRLGIMRESAFSQMTKLCSEALKGIRDIKVAGTEDYFVRAYDAVARKYTHGIAVYFTMEQVPRLAIETIVVAGLIGAILYFKDSGAGSGTLVAVLAMYLVAAYRLMPSVNRIISSILHLQYFEAGFKAFALPLYEALNFATQRMRDRAALPFTQGLGLEKACFRYPESEVPVLDRLELRLKTGEVVGIIGSTGVGKSTLINVILGLLPLDEGSLVVDGRPLAEDQIRSWQAAVAYVPQHVFIADDTLLHNVALGIPDGEIDLQRMRVALELAQLSDLVKELPEGFHSELGERGARLSGGQIQRIGIARALYRDTPVLILDEATSALDIVTEERILEALHRRESKQTVLVVAHRHSTLKHCDRIYRLDSGRIVESLTYAELQH